MKNLIIIIVLTIVITGCNDSTNNQIEKNEHPQALSSENYLEKMNTSKSIFKGTKTYSDIISKGKKIKHRVIYRSDLFENSNLDSIDSQQTEDSLFISSFFFVSGECLNYYPYYEKQDSILLINLPKIITANVVFEDGQPLIEEEGCSLENAIEIRLAIPNNNLPGVNKIFLNSPKSNKEVLFEH